MKKFILNLFVIAMSVLLISGISTAEKKFSFGYYYGINKNSVSVENEKNITIEGRYTSEYGVGVQYIIRPYNYKIGINLEVALRDMKSAIRETLQNSYIYYKDWWSADFIAISIIGKYYPIRVTTIEDFGIEPFLGFGISPQISTGGSEKSDNYNSSFTCLVFGISIGIGAKIELAKGFSIEPELRCQLNLNSAIELTPTFILGESNSIRYNNLLILFPIKISP